MKKYLTLLPLLLPAALAQIAVQKNTSNVITNGNIVIGNNTTLTATGNGSIIATGGTATSVAWANITGKPTTLSGYGVTNTLSTTAPITGGGLLSGNLTLAMPAATSSANGYLTSADWTTFNSKQAGLGPTVSFSANIITANAVKAAGSAGFALQNSGGTAVLTVGAGGGTGSTFSGNIVVPGLIGSGNLTAQGASSGALLTLGQGANGVATVSSPLKSPSFSIDVRWYGATGDGTTNDYAAITTAIAAAGANGTVRFPPGDYATLTALDPLQGQTLDFSPGATLRMAPTGTYNGSGLIDVDSSDVTIRGATFAGRASAIGTFAVNVAAAPRVSLIDCIGSTTLARLVIFTAGSDYGRVIRCTSPGTGPGVHASNHVEFNDSDYGLVDQSTFYGGVNGVEIYQNNGNRIVGIRVVNSVFSELGGSGVNMYGAYGVIVANNVFRRVATHGVFVTNGEVNAGLLSFGNIIEGNYFQDCGITTPGGVPIYLNGDATKVVGNSFISVDRPSLQGSYAVTLNDGNYTEVSSNYVQGGNGGFYQNFGGYVLITNNQLVDIGADGASAIGIVVNGTYGQIQNNLLRDTRSGASRGLDIGVFANSGSSLCNFVQNTVVNSKGLGFYNIGTNNTNDGSGLTNLNANNLAAGTVPAARMPALTGDVTTSSGAVATTLATVNSNVGTFGSATTVPTFTVNGKGLITAASNVTVTDPVFATVTGSPSLALAGASAGAALSLASGSNGGHTFTTRGSGRITGTLNTNNVWSINPGASLVTPNIVLGSDGGKAVALLAGSSGGALLFDSTGFINVSHDSRANLVGGSSTGGTEVARFSSTGLNVTGTLTASSGHYYPPQTAPSNPAAGWVIYTDSGDGNKIKAKASTGTTVTIGTP